MTFDLFILIKEIELIITFIVASSISSIINSSFFKIDFKVDNCFSVKGSFISSISKLSFFIFKLDGDKSSELIEEDEFFLLLFFGVNDKVIIFFLFEGN